ncbi:glycosyltransferase family 4 protein [Kordia zhangzhouensis]|uniref:glycosyltransferase family 4 protein n=1 Tax=Kordia zhangzhouensis TaxID=1620405 RepID=UPI000629A755|nr:glycosyltransferase family 4 protein [Kordia zhangzhouensis]
MILYVGNIVSRHGKTATTIETLGALLQQEGFDIRLTSNKQNKFLRLLDMLWNVFKYRKQVEYVLIDTYSTTNFLYAYYVSQLCRKFELKYIPILHGGNLAQRLQHSKAKSDAIFQHAYVNVSPSLFLKSVFEKYGYTNVQHIPNNVEIENYPFTKRSKVGAKLLWVRSFAEIYHPQMAVNVAHQLKESGVKVSLCMVGPKKDDSFVQTQTLAKQLNVDVTFTGKLSKHEWISLSKDYDIFINTTNFDNTPVSLIEAMALGLPVVSTNVGGIPYLLSDGEDGILVAPENVQEMCTAIKTLLNSPEMVEKLTKNAREKAETFDWNVVKAQWKQLLA